MHIDPYRFKVKPLLKLHFPVTTALSILA
jgi:hypothetical protein